MTRSMHGEPFIWIVCQQAGLHHTSRHTEELTETELTETADMSHIYPTQ